MAEPFEYRRSHESIDDWRKRLETATEVRAELLRQVREAITAVEVGIGWGTASGPIMKKCILSEIDKIAKERGIEL